MEIEKVELKNATQTLTSLEIEYTLRPATELDLEDILEIYNDAILNTTAVYDYHLHTLEMRQRWFAEKLEKNIPVIVADFKGIVVGFASFGAFRSWEAYKKTAEHSVYVHPAYRQRGIAKALLQEIIVSAKQNGIHVLIAGIDASNAISIQLHAQLGFEQVGTLKEVGYKFDRWLDLVFMQRIFKEEHLSD